MHGPSRLQKGRLQRALALPNEAERDLCLENDRLKLLTWHAGGGVLADPALTEDLAADELLLVHRCHQSRTAAQTHHAS